LNNAIQLYIIIYPSYLKFYCGEFLSVEISLFDGWDMIISSILFKYVLYMCRIWS